MSHFANAMKSSPCYRVRPLCLLGLKGGHLIPDLSVLAAAAGASAFHAAVAGAVAGHDGSAGGAGGGVAHVDDVLHGVGGVEDASVFEGGVGGGVEVEAGAGLEVGGDAALGGGAVVVGFELFGERVPGGRVRGRQVCRDAGGCVVGAGGAFGDVDLLGGRGDGDVGGGFAIGGVEVDGGGDGHCLAGGRGAAGHGDAVGGGADAALDGDGGRGGEAGEEVELGAVEEAELDPAEEVIHDGFGVADLLVAGPAGGLEPGVGELFAEHFERHAVLEGERDGGGEGIHEAGNGGTFFCHADEDFARLAVGVEADGDVALVPAEAELVRDGGALGGEAVANGAGGLLGVVGVGVEERLLEVLGELGLEGVDLGLGGLEMLSGGLEDGQVIGGGDAGGGGEGGRGFALGGDGFVDFGLGGFGSGDGYGFFVVGILLFVGIGGHVEGLGALGVVAVDGDGLDALAPGFGVGLGDVFDGAILGEVDGFGDGARQEGLGGGHHFEVAHPVDGTDALGGLEGAIEAGEVLGAEAGRALDGAGGVDVGNDGVHFGLGVAELDERGGDGVVDDFDHAAADELFVLDEGEIGLDAGGVAIHHEADGAGGGEDGDLGVAEAVLLALDEGVVPGVGGGLDELVEVGDGEGLGLVCAAGLV